MKKPTLRELFESVDNVRESYIPESWKDSFNEFMHGQGCLVEDKLDGSGEKECVYFYSDFRMWYFLNRKEIERDLKIDDIIN